MLSFFPFFYYILALFLTIYTYLLLCSYAFFIFFWLLIFLFTFVCYILKYNSHMFRILYEIISICFLFLSHFVSFLKLYLRFFIATKWKRAKKIILKTARSIKIENIVYWIIKNYIAIQMCNIMMDKNEHELQKNISSTL